LGLLSTGGEPLLAGEQKEINLASGFDMQVRQFRASGENLLIWLPSKYGIRPGNTRFARRVQDENIDYWLVDLHESYMALTGRHAYAQFEPGHVKELIDHAVQQGWKNIVLGGESRGAALAMQAARQWQIENPGKTAIKGLLFYHPYLIDRYTRIGEHASFAPVARATNLPVYIFQPQLNTKYLNSQQLIEQLQMGGAAVYFHPLPGVRGGFHLRPVARLNPQETTEHGLIGERIRQAVKLLVRLPTPDKAVTQPDSPVPKRGSDAASRGRLVPIDRDESLPLRLYDDRGRIVDLKDLETEVVLVNFWATWCTPCVKEIASLMRLIEHFDDKPFRVLAVNISESKEHVGAFFTRLGITPNFQVLFDPDGGSARAWRVYAVPSTYLLDKQQKIRFGYRGALKWDKPSVIRTVQDLLR
jgi:thiol-disulfide isomerase/thioredoxin